MFLCRLCFLGAFHFISLIIKLHSFIGNLYITLWNHLHLSLTPSRKRCLTCWKSESQTTSHDDSYLKIVWQVSLLTREQFCCQKIHRSESWTWCIVRSLEKYCTCSCFAMSHSQRHTSTYLSLGIFPSLNQMGRGFFSP